MKSIWRIMFVVGIVVTYICLHFALIVERLTTTFVVVNAIVGTVAAIVTLVGYIKSDLFKRGWNIEIQPPPTPPWKKKEPHSS